MVMYLLPARAHRRLAMMQQQRGAAEAATGGTRSAPGSEPKINGLPGLIASRHSFQGALGLQGGRLTWSASPTEAPPVQMMQSALPAAITRAARVAGRESGTVPQSITVTGKCCSSAVRAYRLAL